MGNCNGIWEILEHKWFSGVDLNKAVLKEKKGPLKIDLFVKNIDEEEFSKGDEDFRMKIGLEEERSFRPMF